MTRSLILREVATSNPEIKTLSIPANPTRPSKSMKMNSLLFKSQ